MPRNPLMAEQNVERDYIMSKILLLEDDISLVDGLQYSLKKNGFEAEIVRTVSEAINSIENIGKYDLLIQIGRASCRERVFRAV